MPTSAQRDLHALFLALDWSCVKIVFAICGRAGVEYVSTVGQELAASTDRKATVGSSTSVTLELRSGWCKYASTALAISDSAVAEAEGGSGVAIADAVLAVAELANGAGHSARSCQ